MNEKQNLYKAGEQNPLGVRIEESNQANAFVMKFDSVDLDDRIFPTVDAAQIYADNLTRITIQEREREAAELAAAKQREEAGEIKRDVEPRTKSLAQEIAQASRGDDAPMQRNQKLQEAYESAAAEAAKAEEARDLEMVARWTAEAVAQEEKPELTSEAAERTVSEELSQDELNLDSDRSL